MVSPRLSGPRVRLSLLAFLALAAVFLARPVVAQTECDRAGCGTVRNSSGTQIVCFTPATPPPSSLWSNAQLQPAWTGALPSERDTTNFNELTENYGSRNWFEGVSIQNGYVLMALAHGIGIWDAHTDPANPAVVAVARYPAITGQFPFLPTGELSKIVFGGIGAADDGVAAIAGYSGAGILVFDLTDKTHPRPAYQNAGKTSDSVYVAKIGGTRYGFLAANGLYVYNLDKAITYTGCLETDGVNAGACPGVLVKQVTTNGSGGSFVAGVDNFVAVTLGTGGFQVFDMSNPLNPVAKLTGVQDRPVQGMAMWKQGTSYYLAARLGKSASVRLSQTAIYDVSCIATANGCGGVAPLSTLSTDSLSGTEYLTFSRSGATPYLYAGGDGYCSGSDGQQREWLLDVSNPASPQDITPSNVLDTHAPYFGVDTHVNVNYWSYFYRESPTGFNLVAPRGGMFNGDYFYRAGRSIFDVHKWIHNVSPTADFSYSPTEIYPGTAVTFSDRSAGVPTSWSWTFQDGAPGSSTAQNPSVSFATAGTKTVSLTASNSTPPPNTATKSVVVLPPTPQIGGITVSPSSPLVCQPVTFTATGVTGQPTLAYSWAVKDSGNNPVAGSSSTGTLNWATTGLAAGAYTATVTVTNGVGSANKSATVTLGALQPLAFGPTGAPTSDAFTSGTVHLHAGATGATEWNWDYGDGQGFRGWTSDPVNGPDPTVVYTATGVKLVTVQIRNCVQSAITSQALSVTIVQTTPLKASFLAQLNLCSLAVYCSANVGDTITFADASTGAELWDYDWAHASNDPATCSFSDLGHTSPVTTHVYSAAGDYYPCLRVRRGASEQNVFVHKDIRVSTSNGGGGGNNGGGGGGGSATLSIGGAGTGSVNTPYIFSASAFNCTATDGAWSWNAGGGTITGASNGSSVTITWSSAGAKGISVTNTGCAGATGTFNVTISDGSNGGGGGGGGTLAALFSFSPSSPNPGDAVSFDGSASTGSPTSYSWNFGDGTGPVTGKAATHSFAVAGSYSVTLTVSAPGTGCPFAPCTTSVSTTKTVVVGTVAPPVSAEFTTSVSCTNVGGFDQCQANAGQAVTFTATTTDATSYQWSFGDGGTAATASTSHTFAQAGNYIVSLTVTKGSSSATKTRRLIVTGTTPPPPSKSVVLPWIAQTRGALVQTSDLYVHNPSANPMTVTLSFRKRGLPDTNPPQASKTIAPGATVYIPDVLGGLFNRENVAGFISLTVDQGDAAPVITSYNTTFQADGKQFGQTISGISMSSLSAAAKAGATGPTKNLVGLINNSDRLAYFGLSNPSDTAVTYHLRLYDKLGKLIGETNPDLTVAPFGQRQFQSAEIESTFGVTNQDDYRVEVQPTAGGGDMLVPYASNLRLSSQDPSFIEAGSSSNAKSYLLGALSAPGANSTLWQTDLLLSNVNTQPVSVDVTFTGIGVNAAPTTPAHVTLQPGETQRLQNVIASQWGINNAIGLLTVKSTSPNGIFPIAQAESYDNSNPAKRFGQSMAALTDSDAAGAGQGQYLAGLRQDANHRTTLWLYNPGTANGVYDLVFRNLDGTVITTTANVQLAGGKLRQFTPAQLPLPAGGVQNGFTLQIVVKGGQVLSAAQVVNNDTNDPSYIQGDVR